MLRSSGFSKTILNNNVIDNSSWDLHSVTEDEFNANLNLNGNKYKIRNLELNDLEQLLRNTHTTEDLINNEEISDPSIIIKPYPKFSYKASRKQKKKHKPRKSCKQKRKNSRKKGNKPHLPSNTRKPKKVKTLQYSPAKVNSRVIY
jgi:hypothetical protein